MDGMGKIHVSKKGIFKKRGLTKKYVEIGGGWCNGRMKEVLRIAEHDWLKVRFCFIICGWPFAKPPPFYAIRP